jgi:hypothetical protein
MSVDRRAREAAATRGGLLGWLMVRWRTRLIWECMLTYRQITLFHSMRLQVAPSDSYRFAQAFGGVMEHQLLRVHVSAPLFLSSKPHCIALQHLPRPSAFKWSPKALATTSFDSSRSQAIFLPLVFSGRA